MKKLQFKLCACAIAFVLALVFAGCDNGGGGGGANFTEGVFVGEADGMKGPLQTRVVFSRRAILDIRVIEHNDTLMFAETPIEVIPALIVQYQSLDVEVVTGATLTSLAILNAVEDAVVQANGNVDRLLGRRVNRPQSTEVVEMNVEIVIVGAGAAGKGAAVFAAERGPAGGTVLLLEKMPGIGGNAILSGGVIQNPNINAFYRPFLPEGSMREAFAQEVEAVLTRPALNMPGRQPEDVVLLSSLQAQARQEWERHQVINPDRVFDSLAFMILEDGEATATAVAGSQRSAAFADWLNDLGMIWQRPATSIAGHPWPRFTRPVAGRLGEGFFIFFNDYIRRNNLQIDTRTETRATRLRQDESSGRVIGVEAQHVSGRRYIITANRGVVLATGGFSANPQMLEYHLGGHWATLNLNRTTNHSGAVGDGLTMGVAVGAQLMMLEAMGPNMITVLPTGDVQTGTLDTLVGMSSSGPFVNDRGERFVDETLSRNAVSQAILLQPRQRMWAISDNTNSMIVDGHTVYGTRIDTLIGRGQLFRANTLQALAGYIGITYAALRETINDFNAAVTNNYCPDTHRTIFPENAAITQPPFFASPRTPAVHVTPGGLLTADWRVLGQNFQPIPGLYAIGEVTLGAGLRVFGDGKDLMTRIIYPAP